MLRRLSLSIRLSLLASVFCLASTTAEAQAPAGYYSSVNTSNSSTLRSTLHQVIDDHQRFPYTSSATDTWNVLELADEDPSNSGRVLDIYRNATYPKMGGGSGPYNREHSWPKSYGFPDDGSSNYPYTDCHQLFLCDSGYNSARSNKPFRDCDAGCNENTTNFNSGAGGGSGVYPGNSNWEDGSFTSGTWEVWMDRRGDIARAQFYMDIRYEGGTHNVTGALEPNLILTNNQSLIDNSNTGNNESVAYMGMLSVLLQWHLDDPVDAREILRNDVIQGFQGNRNPFVDHPEWVDCLFNNNCGPVDTTPPSAPTGLGATASSSLVALNWNNNSEPDLAGYRVYRSVNSGGPYGLISSGIVGASAYNDATVVNGTTYYYVATAEDVAGNESNNSVQVSGTPMGSPGGGGGSGDPWINELHYDNASSDTGEFVEIAGPEGLDLNQWTLVGYNGNGGGTYSTVDLTGVFQDQQECIGTFSFAFDGLQNGAPDGVALVDPQGQVIEFLSYEGEFTASNGDANGMTSVNIGVSESGSTPVGHSLQLGGSGADASDFTWQSAQADTPGLPNVGQFFVGGCVGLPTPPAAPTGLISAANDGSVNLSWAVNSEPDFLGYNVYRSLNSGSGYVQLNGAPQPFTAFFDPNVSNGVTYYYVVTAETTPGLESGFSGQVQATPQDVSPPATPTGLSAFGLDALVLLDWNGNGEGDLAGYNVYRSQNIGGPFVRQNVGLIISSSHDDTSVVNGTEYFYQVSAVDQSANESPLSFDESATPEDVTPPAVPLGFTARTGNSVLHLDWIDNPRGDLAGYNVYRASDLAGPFVRQNLGLVFVNNYDDLTAVNGNDYFYYVTAVDSSANESAASPIDGAVAFASPRVSPWINEIHYQNSGAPVVQSIEIAGDAGVDLRRWQVLLYSRSGHFISATEVLGGALADSGNGFGTRQVSLVGMDTHVGGIVLVDSARRLKQFISYRDVLRALDGPAARLISADIGVAEGKFTSAVQSLQLVGNGSSYFDFTWQAGELETFGQSNVDQSMQP